MDRRTDRQAIKLYFQNMPTTVPQTSIGFDYDEDDDGDGNDAYVIYSHSDSYE